MSHSKIPNKHSARGRIINVLRDFLLSKYFSSYIKVAVIRNRVFTTSSRVNHWQSGSIWTTYLEVDAT